jgi:hypothetical protein
LGLCFDYFISMIKSFLHAILHMLCFILAILKDSQRFIYQFTMNSPGMYNWCFCNGFVINSAQFDVYEDLMYGFLATGKNCGLILHLVPRPTLRSTLDLAHDPTLHLAHDPTLECIGGGWYIGGLWWMNRGSGFCAPSWPPTTELDTPWIGQLQ